MARAEWRTQLLALARELVVPRKNPLRQEIKQADEQKNIPLGVELVKSRLTSAYTYNSYRVIPPNHLSGLFELSC